MLPSTRQLPFHLSQQLRTVAGSDVIWPDVPQPLVEAYGLWTEAAAFDAFERGLLGIPSPVGAQLGQHAGCEQFQMSRWRAFQHD